MRGHTSIGGSAHGSLRSTALYVCRPEGGPRQPPLRSGTLQFSIHALLAVSDDRGGGAQLDMPRSVLHITDNASLLLGSSPNIYESIQMLFPLLVGHSPPFKDMLNWLRFTYIAYRTGAYMVPAYTDLDQSVVSEGYPIFPDIWCHFLNNYPGAYYPTACTIGPPWTKYSYCSPISWEPESS